MDYLILKDILQLTSASLAYYILLIIILLKLDKAPKKS